MPISMGVLRAILLSSQNQAESFVAEDAPPMMVRIAITPTRLAYRLVATHKPVAYACDAEEDAFTLRIYRVTYPDAAEGKGWGEPRYAATPHKICPFTDKAAFLAYLAEMDFSAAENWSPVEPD